MSTPTNLKYPPNLVLISLLSGGLTIAISLVYSLLSITFMVFRFNCSAISETTSTGAGFFWQTIFRVYGQSRSCEGALSVPNLTQDTTVLILVSITLAISVICVAAASTLVSIVQDEKNGKYITWVVYAYVGSCIVSLIVDLTAASHFGVDHSFLTSILKERLVNAAGNYQIDVLRQGALILMVILLKGFIAPIINCIFLVMLIIYVVQYQKWVKNDEHSIHKVGALNAFDQKKSDEAWSHPDTYNSSPFSRGPHINNAFIDNDSPPRTPVRRPDPPQSDYFSNRSFDRSDSWHRPQSTAQQNPRVFSYLEPTPPKVPYAQSPAVEKPSPWRRDPWPQAQSPPVPAPDYSPTQPRRLKSALKPGYM